MRGVNQNPLVILVIKRTVAPHDLQEDSRCLVTAKAELTPSYEIVYNYMHELLSELASRSV